MFCWFVQPIEMPLHCLTKPVRLRFLITAIGSQPFNHQKSVPLVGIGEDSKSISHVHVKHVDVGELVRHSRKSIELRSLISWFNGRLLSSK